MPHSASANERDCSRVYSWNATSNAIRNLDGRNFKRIPFEVNSALACLAVARSAIRHNDAEPRRSELEFIEGNYDIRAKSAPSTR